jgi:hypothetical protein
VFTHRQSNGAKSATEIAKFERREPFDLVGEHSVVAKVDRKDY